jgi:hypothetical protein
MKLLVTGGAGFIGSAVIRHIIRSTDWQVANVDKLTYAGNLESLAEAGASNRHRHYRTDICDRAAIDAIFAEVRPDADPASRRREPRRPLDRRRRALHRDQCRRHLHPARGRTCLLACARRPGEGPLPLPAHLDRRGLRLAGPHGQVHARRRPTRPTRPIPPARRPPTIWCAPGTIPTACRRWRPTARTTTGRIISPRS